MNIRVVGDIRVGKNQPSLTGNAIVDDALIQNFCDQLKNGIHSIRRSINVVAEHFFDPSVPTNDIILMDDRILNSLPDELIADLKIIDVSHTDIVRGNVTNALNALRRYDNGEPVKSQGK